jgi:hypothetical protein
MYSQFFKDLKGKRVEVILTNPTVTLVQTEEPNAVQELNTDVVIRGYFMDKDNQFLYLSYNGEEAQAAMPINNVLSISELVEYDMPDQEEGVYILPDEDELN